MFNACAYDMFHLESLQVFPKQEWIMAGGRLQKTASQRMLALEIAFTFLVRTLTQCHWVPQLEWLPRQSTRVAAEGAAAAIGRPANHRWLPSVSCFSLIRMHNPRWQEQEWLRQQSKR